MLDERGPSPQQDRHRRGGETPEKKENDDEEDLEEEKKKPAGQIALSVSRRTFSMQKNARETRRVLRCTKRRKG